MLDVVWSYRPDDRSKQGATESLPDDLAKQKVKEGLARWPKAVPVPYDQGGVIPKDPTVAANTSGASIAFAGPEKTAVDKVPKQSTSPAS